MITYTQIIVTKFSCSHCGSEWESRDFDFSKQAYVTCQRCADCNEIEDPEE